MFGQNYINISASERDSFIYRIVSLRRLFDLFAGEANVLVKPSKWQDPFENFILRADRVYGQCWTLQKASDAMWRIYSPNAEAVRIRSTVRRLLESLNADRGSTANTQAFIGRVRYLNNQKLKSYAKTIHGKAHRHPAVLASTLMVKRPAFKHEREVRLVFVPQASRDDESDLFSYAVSPHQLIDQIMIDPRVSASDAIALKARLRRTTRFSGAIKRSLLYAPPPNLMAVMLESAKDG
jgi:hypothetical protein